MKEQKIRVKMTLEDKKGNRMFFTNDFVLDEDITLIKSISVDLIETVTEVTTIQSMSMG